MTQHYVSRKIVMAWEQASPEKVLVCGNNCHKGTDICNGYCVGEAVRPPAAPAVPGYTVKYRDGYTSWCPKEAFEDANLAIGHVGQYTYDQQLVVADKVEFQTRLDGLENVHGELAAFERDLLRLYIAITQKKIDSFAHHQHEVAVDASA